MIQVVQPPEVDLNHQNESTTCLHIGFYRIDLYENLGLSVNADYGSEVVTLSGSTVVLSSKSDALIGRVINTA